MTNPSAEPLTGVFRTPVEDNAISSEEPNETGEYTVKRLVLTEEPSTPTSAVTRQFVEQYVADKLRVQEDEQMARFGQKFSTIETEVAKIPVLDLDLDGKNTLLSSIEERLLVLEDQATASSKQLNDLLQDIERIKVDISVQTKLLTNISSDAGNINDKLIALRLSVIDVAGKVRDLELAGKV